MHFRISKATCLSLAMALGLLSPKAYIEGEVVLQDVLWSRDYAEEFDETYFGTCRFAPSPCYANTLPESVQDGVCVKRDTCIPNGGSPYSSCSGGFGECCVFYQSCEKDNPEIYVNELVTRLDFQSHTQCSFKFRKEPNMCQVRLDFVDFDSEKANVDGICEIDKLKILSSATVSDDFTTCGHLTGSHMYLAFGSNDVLQVSLQRSSDSRLGHHSVVATKIPCHSSSRVPDHCLQYFNETSGIVQSFDYGNQQQSNQRYTVCVKHSPLSSGIAWKPCETGNHPGFNIITNPGSPKTGEQCTTDWVQVKGNPKQCDSFAQQTSLWKPYELMVNFDHNEVPPTPPTFTVPVNASNCAAECAAYDVPPFSCRCSEAGACVCLSAGFVPPIGADINNIGFCLEYFQQ